MLFKSLLFIFIPLCAKCNQESCSKENRSDCNLAKNANKYSKETNTFHSRYLKIIEEAKANYKPCPANNCNCHSGVISDDLLPFKGGISKKSIENVHSKGTRYQIIDHRLFREKSCMFPTRCAGIEYFLLKLAPELGDTEFIINTRDWPQVHKNYGVSGPVFSFSKTEDYLDIMYPAWSFWEGGPAISLYPQGIGRWDLHRDLLGKIANETSWEDKQPKAFFRGSRTSAERDSLVLLSREKPHLVDAQYTKNQAWKSLEDTLGVPPAPEVSFDHHCKYKFLFNFRGVAASFRFKHVLLCKSVVFHVGDEWQEFFYKSLKPWIHYIPVKVDASKQEIEELIRFAIDNDGIVKEIAENGFKLIWDHLTLNDVFCYWRKLLEGYADLLTFKPERDESLIEITKR